VRENLKNRKMREGDLEIREGDLEIREGEYENPKHKKSGWGRGLEAI
jgi:hypothetical protein